MMMMMIKKTVASRGSRVPTQLEEGCVGHPNFPFRPAWVLEEVPGRCPDLGSAPELGPVLASVRGSRRVPSLGDDRDCLELDPV